MHTHSCLKAAWSLVLAAAAISALPLAAGAQSQKELSQMADEARKAARKGQVQRADSLYAAYVAAYDNSGAEKGFDYSENLGWLVSRKAQAGQVDQAIALQKQVVDIRSTAPDCTYGQWAVAMNDLASLYSQKGDYANAISTGQEAADMLRQKYGDKHHYYCVALSNLASYHSARGQADDYQQAVALAETAIKHMKKGTPEYANTLNSLVLFYSQTGNRLQANRLSAKARKEASKRLEEDGVVYATVLNNNATRLANAGNYEEAIEYAQTARQCFEKAQQTNTLAYSKLLTNLATFHSHQQNYREAVDLLETALPIIEAAANRQHPDYVRCVSDLAAAYKGVGNLDKADEMAHLSDRVSRQMGDQDNLKYAKSLSKQASTFASNGNFRRAIELERRALDILSRRRDSINMAFSLGALAGYQFSDGDRGQALATARRSLDIFRQRGEQSAYYAQALNNTAILHYNDNDYEQARAYGLQAMQMYRALADTTNAIYARVMANNALFAFMQDSIGTAVRLAGAALHLHSRALGADHPDNVPLLYNLSVYLSKVGQRQRAQDIYRQALELQASQVRTNFLHLTSQEREKFWRQKSYVFRFAPMLAYLDRDNGAMATEAYNSQLFTKGILLNSDVDFKNLLRRSGDQALLEKYNRLEMLRQNEDDFYKTAAGERDEAALRQTREEIYQLERALVRGCKEYGSFTESLGITATQIAQALDDDEAAIEFADVYIQGMGTTYMALILRKGQTAPTVVRLFADEDLKDLKYDGGADFHQAIKDQQGLNRVYDDPRFGSMLWQPIVGQLQGVSKIYFSPTAMLYQMGIEYMPCDSVHRIGDLYQVHRLSSTKLLTARRHPGAISTATVYGGLDYDMDLGQLQRQHERVSMPADMPLLAMNDMQRTLDSLQVRGSVSYLPGTEHEARNIAEQLMQNNVDTHVLMHDEGTEETFKALSGTTQSVVHVATHGFAFSESEVKQHGQQLVFINEQTDNLDNALNYSGLLLSGANYALSGNPLTDGLEDGILTAREIAQVDLSHVDLVVLSACQTALGEIRDDGVFGIQRGFKKAGAHSLLMSLWKVSDRATDVMMTSFYQQLMQGRSRHDAFRRAQQTVRDSGYGAPYYWASFILLDAF